METRRNGVVSSLGDTDDDSSSFHFPKYTGKKAEETDLGRLTRSVSPTGFLLRRSSSLAESASFSAKSGDQVVIRCSSNASFRRNTTLPKSKIKSRLLHPTDDLDEDDVDDPFFDDDLPDEYTKSNLNCFSLLQLASSILIVAALVCSLVLPNLKRKTLWGMQLWKWGVTILVFICGGMISGWFIRIIVFFIERNFLLRKRVLYFVYGLRNAVRNCLWLGWVLLAWNLILHQKVEKEIHSKYLTYITKILVCFLIATLIWLLKTLLVKVLAMSFHVSAFFYRIQDALFNQYVIETLSRGPRNEGGVADGPAGIPMDRLHRLNQKNVSAWNMKRLMNAVRKGVVSTLDEHIRSEKQAQCAAKRIFDNVARPVSKYIYEKDLMRFMIEDEAMKAMHLFEGSTVSDGISIDALKNWLVNVFRERRALALSFNDTKIAVNKLHYLLNVLVGFCVLIICLLILDVPITHFLVFISSQLLLLTFIFGNTFKTTFEAIIFLFVMHPFDVGDRCEIDKVQMIVEEMNLLTTVFLRFDNQKIIYPNSVLATKPISNYYRSPDMKDAIDFCVHMSTPVEKISIMKERVTRYIENKKDHWHPSPSIVMREVEDMNRLKFSVWISHTMNHQDMGERWARRALLVEEMVLIFKNLEIEYRMLPVDVNVRALPSLESDLPSF